MHVSDTDHRGRVEGEDPAGVSQASSAATIAATRRIYKEATMLRSMKGLTGFTIGATDGDIGRVDGCYFDDDRFTVRHLVVDTGGWLSGRKVLISPMALREIDWAGGRIEAALTRAQVEKSPLIATDRPVSRQQEGEYHRYYGYPSYWTGPYLWGAYPYPYPAADRGTTFEQERRWTREDEYDLSGPVLRDYEVRLHDYYGRPGYWSPRSDEAAARRR